MTPTVWRGGRLAYGRPRVMGILNVTPDSFSDGGRNSGREAEAAFAMIDEGADIIDVGGESTRPGYLPVPAEEEIRRTVPVIRRISESSKVPVSVDTMKPEVAAAALDAGAVIVNDVSGLRDPRMAETVSSNGAAVVIMHMPGDPLDVHARVMEERDPMPRISAELSEAAAAAMDAGIGRESIILDPGIGFGKTGGQNLRILNGLGALDTGFPILVGASRKRFLAEAFPGVPREEASLEAARAAVLAGASIVRVHDVAGTVRVLSNVQKDRRRGYGQQGCRHDAVE